MIQRSARWFCLVSLLATGLLFSAGSAHAAELPYYWYGGGNENCWQTGAFGSESHKCDNVGAGFLEVPGRLFNETGNTSTSGDYCAYYHEGDTLNKQDATNEGTITGTSTPSPWSSYQEWDGYGDVCQAYNGTFGHEIQTRAPGSLCGSTTCGMHHYVSFAEQGANNHPWSTSVSNPPLWLSAEADIQTWVGTNSSGWGYICPLFEDTAAPHNILEYCLQEWRGTGNEAAWSDERIGTCAQIAGNRNMDTIQTFYYPGTRFATQLAGSANTEVAKAGWRTYKASITGANLVNAIELDRTAYKQKPGAREANPELGYGCGRSAELSTNPANYVLIGLEQGTEAWQSSGSSYSEIGAAESNLNAHDEFSYRAPEATTGSAPEPRGTSATLNGTVNPWGAATNAYVEYGLNNSYGKSQGPQNPTGINPVPVSFSVTGLTPSTTYHYRVMAQSGGGESHGEDKTFTTPSLPVATTNAASEIHETTATLNGAVNPVGLDTHYYFQYGTSPSYGKTAPAEPGNDAGSGSTGVPVTIPVTGLVSGAKYYFRIVATSYAGASYGAEQTFTTVGQVWSVLSTPNPSGAARSLFSGVACVSASACLGAGNADSSESVSSSLAERWTGAEWQLQPPVLPSGAKSAELMGVSCSSSAACTAIGSYVTSAGTSATLAERWNGTEWAVQSTPNPSGSPVLTGVACPSATSCEAVGYSVVKMKDSTVAESWNGTEWKLQTSPNPNESINKLNAVSCTSSSACTAVGGTGGTIPIVERWNGMIWSVQTVAPGSGGTMQSVSCSTASACVAVGNSSKANLAERWNGTEWTLLSAPTPSGASESLLSSVSCSSTTSCIAAGASGELAKAPNGLIESWNGSEWGVTTIPYPTGAKKSQLYGLSCAGTYCTAVGYYENSSGAIVTLAEAN
jgi:hypothetical protein